MRIRRRQEKLESYTQKPQRKSTGKGKQTTDSEPRNHLSVPRRSDNAAIASRYWCSTAAFDTCIPKGGRNELNPQKGGGGGLIRVSMERVVLDSGEINDMKVLVCGWDTSCPSK